MDNWWKIKKCWTLSRSGVRYVFIWSPIRHISLQSGMSMSVSNQACQSPIRHVNVSLGSGMQVSVQACQSPIRHVKASLRSSMPVSNQACQCQSPIRSPFSCKITGYVFSKFFCMYISQSRYWSFLAKILKFSPSYVFNVVQYTQHSNLVYRYVLGDNFTGFFSHFPGFFPSRVYTTCSNY